MLLLVAALVGDVDYQAWFPGTSSIDEVEAIPPAFRGVWGASAAACKAQAGTERIHVKAGGVDYWEAGARLERVTQAGQERTIKLKLSYEGEGEFWDRIETWGLDTGGNRLSVSVDGNASPTVFVKCQR